MDSDQVLCRLPPDSPVDHPDAAIRFTEPRGWFSAIHERLGYRYDSVQMGELGITTGELKLRSGCVAERANVTQDRLESEMNMGLLVHLMRERLPRAEYCKNGVFSEDLMRVHLHKLTKQYYTGKDKSAKMIDVHKDTITQSYVLSERVKDFLWAGQDCETKKRSGFYGAYHQFGRTAVIGLSGLVVAGLLYRLL
jgi:hypothetical protein